MDDKVQLKLSRSPVAEHILAVLKEHKGEGMRFRDIKLALVKKGLVHSDSQICICYTWLVKVGLVVKNGKFYSLSEDVKSDG
jgi:hypothetical protein